MSFQVTLKEVTVENIVKGKARYSVANITYDYKGETRTSKMLSFVNPDIFKQIQEIKVGEMISVTTTKNAKGYDEWAKIEPVAAGQVEAAPKSGGRVMGSNYETAQERAENRMRIVKQSSLSNAIATLGAQATVESVFDLAERYFDWVYAGTTEEVSTEQA